MGTHTLDGKYPNQTKQRRKNGQKPRYLSTEETESFLPPQPKLTPKQQAFLALYAAGVPQREAGIKSGLKSTGSIYRTLTNPLAQQYLSSLRSEARALAAYDLNCAMDEALKSMQFAYENKQCMAHVRAVELRAKLSGLLIERLEVATVDLTGSLNNARSRVLRVIEQATDALKHLPEAEAQAGQKLRSESPDTRKPSTIPADKSTYYDRKA